MAIAPRQDGFTLIELLAVMALVAIACALLAAGMSRGLAGTRERQATTALLQVLREARVEARSTRQVVIVEFDLPARCYRRQTQAPRCLPDALLWTLHTAAAPGGRGSSIRFYPDGSSSGGNLRLRSAARETRIDVSWLTGVASLKGPRS